MSYALVACVLLGLILVYWFPLRHLFGRWGAAPADLSRAMPGDAMVTSPTFVATLAVSVDALPDDVWPWLVQIGFRRGLYSYDWLDRLFGYLDRPSATRILPEFQHLAVGDVIPMGGSPGFPVAAIEPGRALVLGGQSDDFAWVWQFGLYPIDRTRTRLVSRNSGRVPNTIGSWLFMRVIEPAAFLMTRRMLIGVKRRAEALAATRRAGSTRAA